MIGYFWAGIWKKIFSYLKSAPSKLSKRKTWNKENAYILDRKCVIWVFLTEKALFGHFWKRTLNKLLSDLKSGPSNLCIWKISQKKTKMPKLEIKNPWFMNFCARIWKQFCHISNQHPRTCLTAKFRANTKMLKFAPKNAFFGYFGHILGNYCHIWNQHLQICLIGKFCEETKMPKFGNKNALFGYFLARNLENYCHF